MTLTPGSDAGAGEKTDEGEHAQSDDGELPALTEEDFPGGLLFGFFPKFAFGLESVLEKLHGIGRGDRDDLGQVVGHEIAASGGDGDEAEQDDG